MFENLKADLKRLSPDGRAGLRTLVAGLLSQGFQAIVVYRLFSWLHRRGLPGQPLRFFCERFIEVTTGISIPARCRIGAGLRIHHFGGIILHPTAVLGENCTLYHGVTIGDKGGAGGAAVIGDNVLLGAGAKILGELTIGDNVIVGANAVVTRDVPSDTVAVGSPARCHSRRDEKMTNNPEVPAPVRVMDFRGTYKGGGGPDKTILNSAAMHNPLIVDVRLAYLRDPNDQEFQIGDRARSMDLKYYEFLDRAVLDFRCIRYLNTFVRQERIELLHAHDDKTSLYGVLLKVLNPSLKLVFTCHLHTPLERKTYSTKIAFIKALIRRKIVIWLMKCYVRPIMAVSEHTRQSLAQDGLPSSQSISLRNCIDVNIWEKTSGKPVLRQELSLKKSEVLVGTVARIAQGHKDLPTFYKVAQKICQKLNNVRFVIVGDGHGTLLDEARQEVLRLGLDQKLVFTGHRNDLLDIYSSFDLFLMTSYTEGLPNTVLEAMAMEIPVVSTAVAGVTELIEDGKDGILCPVRDVDGLAEAVIKVLCNQELRQNLTHAGRKRIEGQFNFADRVRALEEIYCRVAGAGIERPAVPAANGN